MTREDYVLLWIDFSFGPQSISKNAHRSKHISAGGMFVTWQSHVHREKKQTIPLEKQLEQSMAVCVCVCVYTPQQGLALLSGSGAWPGTTRLPGQARW